MYEVEFTPTCGICEIVVAELESLLQSQATLQVIESRLDYVCNLLEHESQKLSKICRMVVSQYTPKLIQLIEQGVDNSCQYLHICTSSSYIGTFNSLDKCTLCKLTVGEVYHLLDQHEVKEVILDTLDRMCVLFPKTDEQKECDDFIDMFAEMIVNFLEHDEDPSTLCDQLNVCTA